MIEGVSADIRRSAGIEEILSRVRERERAIADAATEKLIRLNKEYATRLRLERIQFFRPHPKQQEFYHAGEKYRRRIILGGNRSGKSESSCAEAVAWSLGERLWLPIDHPDRIVIHPATGKPVPVPNIGLIAAESFTEQVQKVIIPKLIGNAEDGFGGLIPKRLFKKCKRNQQGVVVEIYLTNGSIIYVKSYEQESKLFESDTYNWYYCDEPPPREHYIAMRRGGVDTRAPIWFAMTPLKEAWIFDELVQKTEEVFTIYFDMRDNVGYGITEEAVAEFEAELSEDEIEQRIHGKFFHLGGVVYKKYGAVHRVPRPVVRRGEQEFNAQWGFYMAIDCHPREPHAALWLGVHPLRRNFVIGELMNDHPLNLVSHFCMKMREYEDEFLRITRIGTPIRLIDSLSYTPDPIAGGSVWDEFARCGFVCGPGAKDPLGGIRLVQKELNYDPKRGEFPNLFFYDDLPEIHWQMGHYAWEEWSKKKQQTTSPRQMPRKKRDHLVECLHRIMMMDPMPGQFIEIQPPQGEDREGRYAVETDEPCEGY